MTNIKLIVFVQALVVVIFMAFWLLTALFEKKTIHFKVLLISMGFVFLLSLFTIYGLSDCRVVVYLKPDNIINNSFSKRVQTSFRF